MEKTLSLKLEEHNFKLRVSTILNSWKLHRARLYLLLNLKHLRLKVNIDTAPSSKQPLKSKLFTFLKKLPSKCLQKHSNFSIRRGHSCFKNPGFSTQKNLMTLGSTLGREEPFVSSVLANFAYLSHSVCEKNISGIIVHTTTLLVSLAILFVNLQTRVSYALMVLSPVLGSFIGLSLNYFGNISKDTCWAWNYLICFVCLHLFTQAMLSRFFKCLWRKTSTRLTGLLLSGLIYSVSLLATHFGHSKSSRLTLL